MYAHEYGQQPDGFVLKAPPFSLDPTSKGPTIPLSRGQSLQSRATSAPLHGLHPRGMPRWQVPRNMWTPSLSRSARCWTLSCTLLAFEAYIIETQSSGQHNIMESMMQSVSDNFFFSNVFLSILFRAKFQLLYKLLDSTYQRLSISDTEKIITKNKIQEYSVYIFFLIKFIPRKKLPIIKLINIIKKNTYHSLEKKNDAKRVKKHNASRVNEALSTENIKGVSFSLLSLLWM